MTAECRDQRGDLAAEALGRLEPARRTALRAHLDGCPECRDELSELEAVARALPAADPSRLTPAEEAPPDLSERVLGRVARERVRRRRRRAGTVAGLAAAAAAAVLVVALVSGSPSSGDREVAFPVRPAGSEAVAVLAERPWGTEVALEVRGLEPGSRYWLWLTGEDGRRVGAGSFRGTSGTARVVLASALPLPDVDRVWLTDGDDEVVLDGWLDP